MSREVEPRVAGVQDRRIDTSIALATHDRGIDTHTHLPRFNEQAARALLPGQMVDEIMGGKNLVVVFGPNGNNADRFSKGWEEQGLLIAPAGRFKVGKVGNIDIDPALQFDITKAEDSERLDALLASGAVSSVYDSTPAQVHLSNFNRVRPHLESGALPKYVTTKPVADSFDHYLEFKRLLAAQAEISEGTEGTLKDKFFIHEHYMAKGAWVALRANLNEATNILGRLTRFTVSIQEEQTIEDQGRQNTLREGIMQDLSPHTASLALDVQRIINSGGRYTISNRSEPVHAEVPLLSTVHYDPSDLDETVDTGFIVKARTTIKDNQEHEGEDVHELLYEWDAGKGLVNKKEVRMEFQHPDRPEEFSTIVIDLQNNTITAPESVAHLFAGEIDNDNGYGKTTASALNGTDPTLIFQQWDDGFKVRKWEETLRRKNQDPQPIHYPVSEQRRPIEELVETLKAA